MSVEMWFRRRPRQLMIVMNDGMMASQYPTTRDRARNSYLINASLFQIHHCISEHIVN